MSTLFQQPETMGTMRPRPYQAEAMEALHNYICAHDKNPCVVIPTGGGKSIMIAWAIAQWKMDHPPFRCAILAHRKELVAQNAAELRGLWPGGDIGIYSAGLRSKDTENSIIYASIDSIYNKAGEFPPFDCLLIDEAHRIPARGEGKYRSFIDDCRTFNKALRVVGFTATPYRMGCGPICHDDHILHEVCYEAHIGSLINDGFLCRLRSKVGADLPDLSEVRRNSGGDYVIKSLAEKMDTNELVSDTVRDAMKIINAEQRQQVIWFCVDVKHCKMVSQELRKYGVEAPVVTANTGIRDRDRYADGFKSGRFRHLCNVNVYTEGFNAKAVDCIVLLRPTLSKGLYVQMVGRGLRLHPKKTDCLILDYARCIEQHGPVDAIDPGDVVTIECKGCGDVFSKAVRKCPNCGWDVPKIIIEKAEAEERERRMHENKASSRSILSSEPEVLTVDGVTVHRHRKQGAPDSIRVQYRCGLTTVREWVCLDHPGFAGSKAKAWWARRFGRESAATITVDDALADMFLGQQLAAMTETITVTRSGKYLEIRDYHLNTDRMTHAN